MNKNILEIENINKYFSRQIVNHFGENEDERYFILNDLNIRFPENKITSIIGGNGSGKTTLFNIISGLIEQDSGKIFFRKNGNFTDISNEKAYKIARMGIGRLFQENRIFKELSVIDNMLIADNTLNGESILKNIFQPKFSRYYYKTLEENVYTTFNELFGNHNVLWEKRNELAGNLSYGQQKLISIARLLIGKYSLLLLDEPAAGLNPEMISQLEKIIRILKSKGMTLIIIEHNVDFILKISDFCCFISGGRLSLFGTPQDLLGNTEISDSYLDYLC